MWRVLFRHLPPVVFHPAGIPGFFLHFAVPDLGGCSLLRTSSVSAEEHRKLDSRTVFQHLAQFAVRQQILVQAVVYEKPLEEFHTFSRTSGLSS